MSRTSSERRRVAAERRLAQLRRDPGQPERRVDAGLGRRVGERLERRDVRRRAGGAHQLGAEALGRRDHQIDRHALDGQPARPPLAPLDHRDDLRQRCEAGEHRRRIGGRADHRELLAGVAPAARVAGRLAVQRARDRAHERARPIEQQPGGAARSRSRARAPPSPAPRASARRRARLAAAPPPPPRGTPPACARRAPARSRASACVVRPRKRPEADEPGHELALELAQLGDLPGLHQLAQPRLDPGPDAAQLP